MNAGCLVLAAALAACIVTPETAWARTEREIATGTGPATLHGTLALPDGPARVPGVLILAGSGPVDRDGNLPSLSNDSLKLLARGLADRGVRRCGPTSAASARAGRPGRGRGTCASAPT